jgi:hypothetical protein
MTLAVVLSLQTQVVLNLVPTALPNALWETASPPAHVPKHVLHAVFLV